MEDSPRTQAEEDDEVSEKRERAKEREKTPPRHLPKFVLEEPPKVEKPQTKFTIPGNLLERMTGKLGVKERVSDEEKTEETPKEATETTADEIETVAASSEDNPEPDYDKEVAEPIVGEQQEAIKEPEAEADPSENPVLATTNAAKPAVQVPAMEAANWESEDEVLLNGTEDSTRPSSGEVSPAAADEHEDFAEIPPPPEAEGETPDAETGPVAPDLLEAGLGSEGPPEPPEDEPPTDMEEEPAEEPDPAASSGSGSGGGSGSGYGHGGGAMGASGGGGWYSAAAADRERVHQRELELAEYHGKKTGLRHGLAAGLLFGWMFGRHGKKKQAKGFEKQLKSKDKEIKGLKSEQYVAAERLEAVKRTQEQLAANIRKNEVTPVLAPEKVPPVAPETLKPAINVIKTLEKKVERTIEHSPELIKLKPAYIYEAPRAAEKLSVRPEFAPVSAAVAAAAAERRPQAMEKALKLEIPPEHQEITEETYKVEAGHHVETSAWHRIEIDEKTGKPVNNPEVAYGEEFKHEQRQEVLTDDAAHSTGSSTSRKTATAAGPSGGGPAAQLGGLAAASFTQDDTTYDHKQTHSGLGAQPASPTAEEPAKKGLLRFAAMPTIWVIAIVVIVVLFIVGVLR